MMAGFVISCGDDSKNDNNWGITNPLGVEFNGNFTTGCEAGTSTSSTENVDIENSVITVTDLKFSGVNCQQENLIKKEVLKIAYNVTGDYKEATVILAINESRSGTETFYVEEEVNAANSEEHLGYSDWAVGVEKDITANLQQGISIANPQQYSIIKVSGDNLYRNDYSPDDGDNNPTFDGEGHDEYYRVGSR